MFEAVYLWDACIYKFSSCTEHISAEWINVWIQTGNLALYQLAQRWLAWFFALVFLQDLERQESEVLSRCIVEHSILQAEVNELEEMIQDSTADECLYDFFEKILHDSNESLNLMKMVIVEFSMYTWIPW